MSLSAKIHGMSGAIGFTAIAIASFVFARYFVWAKQYIWAVLSCVVGSSVMGVTLYLVLYSGGEVSSFNYIPVWISGTILWLYVSLIAWKLRKSAEKALTSNS